MDMGVVGLQIGTGVALVCQTIGYVVIILYTDFQSVADEAKQRFGTFSELEKPKEDIETFE